MSNVHTGYTVHKIIVFIKCKYLQEVEGLLDHSSESANTTLFTLSKGKQMVV